LKILIDADCLLSRSLLQQEVRLACSARLRATGGSDPPWLAPAAEASCRAEPLLWPRHSRSQQCRSIRKKCHSLLASPQCNIRRSNCSDERTLLKKWSCCMH
jgi:hypothetical protein